MEAANRQESSGMSEHCLGELVRTLAALQQNTKGGFLEVVQQEVQFLTSKAREISQLRKLGMGRLKMKIEYLAEEASERVLAADNFCSEVEKSLKQSERQCFKRIERLERDRLQKQIEIKTMIDQQILAIVDQNNITKDVAQHFCQYDQAFQRVGLILEEWNTQKLKIQSLKEGVEALIKQQRQSRANRHKRNALSLNQLRHRRVVLQKTLELSNHKIRKETEKWSNKKLQQISQIVELLQQKLIR